MAEGIRDRIIGEVGYDTAERIFQILDEERAQRCTDPDCIRWFPHSRLSRHTWRHEVCPPVSLGLLGPRCVICGQPVWRRIHRVRSRGNA